VVLVWRLALASRASRTVQGGLIAGGLAVLFGAETAVSLGGNLGLLPLAGVPFPLLSYGGTALLVHLAAIGMVVGIRRDGERRRLWAPAARRRRRPRLVRAAAALLTLLLCGFSGYGARLHLVDGPALGEVGQREMLRCVALPAPRGQITDRDGAPLAVSIDVGPHAVDQVLAAPALLLGRPGDLEKLAEAMDQPAQLVSATLTAHRAGAADQTDRVALGRGRQARPGRHRRRTAGPPAAPVLPDRSAGRTGRRLYRCRAAGHPPPGRQYRHRRRRIFPGTRACARSAAFR
jgi:hypothetical protein